MTFKYYVLDDRGEPVEWPMLESAFWFERNRKRCQLAHTRIVAEKWEAHVSTVFLWCDHNFYDDGPPVLWETMVFGGPLWDTQVRYRTRLEAQAGHEVMVARVRAETVK